MDVGSVSSDVIVFDGSERGTHAPHDGELARARSRTESVRCKTAQNWRLKDPFKVTKINRFNAGEANLVKLFAECDKQKADRVWKIYRGEQKNITSRDAQK